MLHQFHGKHHNFAQENKQPFLTHRAVQFHTEGVSSPPCKQSLSPTPPPKKNKGVKALFARCLLLRSGLKVKAKIPGIFGSQGEHSATSKVICFLKLPCPIHRWNKM